MTRSSSQLDRALDRITTHLRAHVTELRRLERAGASPSEIQERREVIARLQTHLARLVRSTLAPRRATGPGF
jgi:hypothetical protein